MKFKLPLLVLIFISNISIAQHKKAYQIFNSKGKKISYSKIIKTSKTADILFFGELHNNAISHWLQFELTVDALKNRKVKLGAEMFEADNQDEVNKYLEEEIDAKQFAQQARLWPNYKTDYRPLIDLAKENKLQFIATNVPRRYASLVYKKGTESLDTLSLEEKAWMAPLPFAYNPELSCYKKMLSMGRGHGGHNFPKAQALKDATMAYFILENFQKGELFIHYNGAYHSDFKEGIIWYIKQKNTELNILSISTVTQTQLKKLDKEHIGKADYIICVDENMTSTY
jgi:uncharacterized iron-regulated protein